MVKRHRNIICVIIPRRQALLHHRKSLKNLEIFLYWIVRTDVSGGNNLVDELFEIESSLREHPTTENIMENKSCQRYLNYKSYIYINLIITKDQRLILR